MDDENKKLKIKKWNYLVVLIIVISIAGIYLTNEIDAFANTIDEEIRYSETEINRIIDEAHTNEINNNLLDVQIVTYRMAMETSNDTSFQLYNWLLNRTMEEKTQNLEALVNISHRLTNEIDWYNELVETNEDCRGVFSFNNFLQLILQIIFPITTLFLGLIYGDNQDYKMFAKKSLLVILILLLVINIIIIIIYSGINYYLFDEGLNLVSLISFILFVILILGYKTELSELKMEANSTSNSDE
jgi:hypothetical protein